jgi:hypothetical protein
MIRPNAARVIGLSLLMLASAAAAGCQTSATLRQGKGALIEGEALMGEYNSDEALFWVDSAGRQFVILALEPFAPASETADGDRGPAALDANPPAAHRYYLQLAVQVGGGDFAIGDRPAGGQVFAQHFVYEPGQNKPAMVRSALRGHIRTNPYVFVGGFDQKQWWTHGSFDLRMSGDVRLQGEFTARPDTGRVKEFLRNKHL